MILRLVDDAVTAGARHAQACRLLGLDVRTVQRWRRSGVGDDGRAGPKTRPKNKLSRREAQKILRVVNTPKYRDLSPKQIVPTLADAGCYLASESTMYRLLRREGQMKHRGPARVPQRRHRPSQYRATAPNQVWSWDITYLRSPVRGAFYYLYMVVDVWSRKIVGWAVHDRELGHHASRLIDAACAAEGVRRDALVLHADNGGPMKAATLLATMNKLGIVPSFSRPRVSNDNPYSEALFRTVKYRPGFPRAGFPSFDAATAWVEEFVTWYNSVHRHSAIAYVTPAQRHCGQDAAILRRREKLYHAARAARPERWSGGVRNWSPPADVWLNPAPAEEGANKEQRNSA